MLPFDLIRFLFYQYPELSTYKKPHLVFLVAIFSSMYRVETVRFFFWQIYNHKHFFIITFFFCLREYIIWNNYKTGHRKADHLFDLLFSLSGNCIYYSNPSSSIFPHLPSAIDFIFLCCLSLRSDLRLPSFLQILIISFLFNDSFFIVNFYYSR